MCHSRLQTHTANADLTQAYPSGVMTSLLRRLPLGAQVGISGPDAAARERASELRAALERHSSVVFMVGGTGIFAVFSIIAEVITKPNAPHFLLLHGYAHEADMLLGSELKHLEELYPGKLRQSVFLEQPPVDWTGEVGFITAAAIEKHSHSLSGSLYVTCGPPAMHRAMGRNLDQLAVSTKLRIDL
eukprot:TRINITY_DN9629_c0_g1_i6.p1 TRINITY_DN9629_c0_g1~~TRINITY_DN9629_c0_g1_i6.p1  ORF type:complete len:187 (-),score=31.58 TRINITY_DN9629_c0_g1_i6:256-816(-)